MNTIAEFTIIGRVGEIRQVGTTLRVSVASSYSRKDNRGEWVERTRWNEVTVFGESTRGYVKRNIVKGDLVFTSGSMGQTKWEKDGETFYGVTLAGERIEASARGRTIRTTVPTSRRRSGRRAATIRTTYRSDSLPKTGEASASPPLSRPYRRRRGMYAFQFMDATWRIAHFTNSSTPYPVDAEAQRR
jgi:single-strand DNA-binding protein